MLEFVIRRYGLKRDELHMSPLGNGLINSTWKLSVDGKDYVLQKVNDEVFKKPEDIDWNLDYIIKEIIPVPLIQAESKSFKDKMKIEITHSTLSERKYRGQAVYYRVIDELNKN